MKIGVISDTHGCAARWTLAYEKFLRDADFILHAGDLLYHGPRNPVPKDYDPAELAARINACQVPLVGAKGNCDSEVDASVLEAPVEAPYATVVAGGMRIVVTHGHLCETAAQKLRLAKHWKADLFVSGHTHVAGVYRQDGVIFLNPGSPALTKREDGRATIALVGAEKIEIVDIDTDEIIETLPR